LAESDFLTHENLYDLPSLPRSLVFLGGGPVACEFAQAFARLGTRVMLVQKGTRVLEREDDDVSAEALKSLRAAGVEVHLNSTVLAAGRDEKGAWLQLENETLRAAHLVVAVGKVCDLSGLNAEAAGVRWTERGVEVDAYLRAARNLWACGDVTGAPYFTHRAEYQGRIAAQNALLPVRAKADDRALPRVTYLDPEVASVGEGESAQTKTYRVPFATLDRAIIAGETQGFCKISASHSGRIVGASIVGASAGEIIALLAQCVRDGVLISELGEAVFAYPTLSEIAHRAGQQYFQELLRQPLLQRVTRRLTQRA
jgi:pyruvate/2-oxoglutarate dehydrogenase complex dihydrolipoamide dehydrogenase (E3) component